MEYPINNNLDQLIIKIKSVKNNYVLIEHLLKEIEGSDKILDEIKDIINLMPIISDIRSNYINNKNNYELMQKEVTELNEDLKARIDEKLIIEQLNKKYLEEIKSQKVKISNLESNIDKSNLNINELNNHLTITTNQFEDLKKANYDLSNNNKILETKVINSIELIESYKSEINKLTNDITLKNTQYEELNKNYSEISIKLLDKQLCNDELTGTIQKNNKQITELYNKLNEMYFKDEEIKMLKEDVTIIKNKNNDLEKDIQIKQMLIDNLQNDLKEIIAVKDEKLHNFELLEKSFNDLNDKLQQKTNEYNALMNMKLNQSKKCVII